MRAHLPARNPYKVRLFPVAVERLNLKIQHGDELKSVRVIPPMLPFAESLSLLQFCRSEVPNEALGVGLTRSRFTNKSVGQH
jgi:hypothetical protein